MKKHLVCCLALAACAPSASPVIPPSTGDGPRPELVLIWSGHGKAERLEGGEWKRIPSFDYEFSVEQRRFGGHWESVKHMHRRHPGYDGSAGPRDQTMFFRLDYTTAPDGVRSTIQSSLGNGQGESDREFREARLELRPEISSFAPFNLYRITQHYAYESASLSETVELIKQKDGTETHWVRNHETATLFATHPFQAAPSVWSK
ncbi:hypothetical protein BO221_03360 [Archangium sp. Cb G35]|uniref:hypothetical protein n=1 Tax=Archangium sp. Cb G35 TaxID=1920190 RepID=UPI0009371EA3|nr:hypothetical protein [Archangium sp. Cb G35]OJT27047.1 hypothetical protein BO221_03360 [Archangium sp. Cb G35]